MILGIDTSDRSVSVALGHHGELVDARDESTGSTSESLIPIIDELLSTNQLSSRDLTAIVIARGPGSFTGVRAAIATGCGMQAGLAVPLYGVSVFEPRVYARRVAGGKSRILGSITANKEDFFVAKIELCSEAETTSISVMEPFFVADQSQINEILAEGYEQVNLDVAEVKNPASCLVQYAMDRLSAKISAQGAHDSWLESREVSQVVEPIYLKPVNAKTLKERGVNFGS